MSNLLHNLLGDPPTLPHLSPAAPSDAPPYDQSFPPSDPIVPSVDNTSSTLQTAPVLGGHADNLQGGVVGKDYSASTLQGAHFPTPSTTDDHPGGGDSTSSGPAPPGAILGGHADNLQGGVIGKDYSASTLQGAHFPTTSSTDDHPGGNHPSSSSTVVNSYSTGTPHESQPVQSQSEQVAKQADRDFAPTSENVPASEGEKERGGPAAVVEDQHDKKGLKDKLKTGLNKVIHPRRSSTSQEDAQVPEPSYAELYAQTVTSKLSEDDLARSHLTQEEIKREADRLRRDEGPGMHNRDPKV